MWRIHDEAWDDTREEETRVVLAHDISITLSQAILLVPTKQTRAVRQDKRVSSNLTWPLLSISSLKIHWKEQQNANQEGSKCALTALLRKSTNSSEVLLKSPHWQELGSGVRWGSVCVCVHGFDLQGVLRTCAQTGPALQASISRNAMYIYFWNSLIRFCLEI